MEVCWVAEIEPGAGKGPAGGNDAERQSRSPKLHPYPTQNVPVQRRTGRLSGDWLVQRKQYSRRDSRPQWLSVGLVLK